MFPDTKEIGFDSFPEDTDVVSYASIETTINLGDGADTYVSEVVTVEAMVGPCNQ